jgi:hypothetical protein
MKAQRCAFSRERNREKIFECPPKSSYRPNISRAAEDFPNGNVDRQEWSLVAE